MDQGDDLQGFEFDPNEVIGWDPSVREIMDTNWGIQHSDSALTNLPLATVVTGYQKSFLATIPIGENADAQVSRDVPNWESLDSFPTGTFSASNRSPPQSTWMQQPDNLPASNNNGIVWPAYHGLAENDSNASPACWGWSDSVSVADSTIPSDQTLQSMWIQQPANIPTFNNEGSVWPLYHGLEESNLNASSASHALTLPLDGSYQSWGSNAMDYPDAMNPENSFEQSSFTESIDPLPYFTGDLTPSNSPTGPDLAPINAKIDPSKKNGSKKPKILCPVRGCSSSFLRPYELKRHADTMHNRRFNIYCFVYGCKRLEQPFPRKDKFREHWRKHHQNAVQFFCLGKDCPLGPFDLVGLMAHLSAAHPSSDLWKPNIKDSLKEVSIEIRRIGTDLFRFQRLHSCPLAFLGCNFRYDNPAPGALQDHIECHPLEDRSRGFIALRSLGSYYQWDYGLAHCPMCDSEICDQNMHVDIFLQHIVDEHSREERLLHKTQLMDLLCPTTEFRDELQSWKRWYDWRIMDLVETLLAEFSESSDSDSANDQSSLEIPI